MKFATAKEHRDYFQKQGWIEFEDLLSNDQLILANQAIDQVLAARLSVPQDRLHLSSSEKFYLQGRDLWRSNLILRKLVTHTRFAEIAAELIEKKPLRLGYDQLFPARQQKPFSPESSQIYSNFLEKTLSLEMMSCLSEIACGLVLTFNEKQESFSENHLMEGANVFSNHAGNIIFFKPDLLINWNYLYAHLGQRFYLIVYTYPSAHYQLQSQDPHTHALKRLGYIFNDKLNDHLHPIIYR